MTDNPMTANSNHSSGPPPSSPTGQPSEQPGTSADRPSRVPWPPILIAAAVIAAIALGAVWPLTWPGERDLASRLVGHGIGLAGIALLAWSVIAMRRRGTTVLPDQPATALVTDGPFRFRRNPIYIADALILLGAAELTENIWFAIVVLPFLALVTWLAILPEERHLEARFGEAYRAYKQRTRRLI
jgi:protein-S-isoprenylcysteine O-methyltransferase Ste14